MPTKTSLAAEHPPWPELGHEAPSVRETKCPASILRLDRAGQDLRAPIPPALGGRFFPLFAVLAFAGLAVFSRFALHWHLPFAQCWLRKLTGIPCPTCGCTRSLAAWSHLDLEQALRFNPLFFLLCVALIVWLMVWVVERISRRALLPALRVRFNRRPLWKLGAALLALNWLYLCLTLPK